MLHMHITRSVLYPLGVEPSPMLIKELLEAIWFILHTIGEFLLIHILWEKYKSGPHHSLVEFIIVLSFIGMGISYVVLKILEARLRAIPDAVVIDASRMALRRYLYYAKRIGIILLLAFIIEIAVNLVGIIVALILNSFGLMNVYSPFMLILGSALLILFFTWFGIKVEREGRWKHLFYIAASVSLLTIIFTSAVMLLPGWNTFAWGILAGGILVVFIQTFGTMGIGGAIANKVKAS